MNKRLLLRIIYLSKRDLYPLKVVYDAGLVVSFAFASVKHGMRMILGHKQPPQVGNRSDKSVGFNGSYEPGHAK